MPNRFRKGDNRNRRSSGPGGGSNARGQYDQSGEQYQRRHRHRVVGIDRQLPGSRESQGPYTGVQSSNAAYRAGGHNRQRMQGATSRFLYTPQGQVMSAVDTRGDSRASGFGRSPDRSTSGYRSSHRVDAPIETTESSWQERQVFGNGNSSIIPTASGLLPTPTQATLQRKGVASHLAARLVVQSRPPPPPRVLVDSRSVAAGHHRGNIPASHLPPPPPGASAGSGFRQHPGKPAGQRSRASASRGLLVELGGRMPSLADTHHPEAARNGTTHPGSTRHGAPGGSEVRPPGPPGFLGAAARTRTGPVRPTGEYLARGMQHAKQPQRSSGRFGWIPSPEAGNQTWAAQYRSHVPRPPPPPQVHGGSRKVRHQGQSLDLGNRLARQHGSKLHVSIPAAASRSGTSLLGRPTMSRSRQSQSRDGAEDIGVSPTGEEVNDASEDWGEVRKQMLRRRAALFARQRAQPVPQHHGLAGTGQQGQASAPRSSRWGPSVRVDAEKKDKVGAARRLTASGIKPARFQLIALSRRLDQGAPSRPETSISEILPPSVEPSKGEHEAVYTSPLQQLALACRPNHDDKVASPAEVPDVPEPGQLAAAWLDFDQHAVAEHDSAGWVGLWPIPSRSAVNDAMARLREREQLLSQSIQLQEESILASQKSIEKSKDGLVEALNDVVPSVGSLAQRPQAGMDDLWQAVQAVTRELSFQTDNIHDEYDTKVASHDASGGPKATTTNVGPTCNTQRTLLLSRLRHSSGHKGKDTPLRCTGRTPMLARLHSLYLLGASLDQSGSGSSHVEETPSAWRFASPRARADRCRLAAEWVSGSGAARLQTMHQGPVGLLRLAEQLDLKASTSESLHGHDDLVSRWVARSSTMQSARYVCDSPVHQAIAGLGVQSHCGDLPGLAAARQFRSVVGLAPAILLNMGATALSSNLALARTSSSLTTPSRLRARQRLQGSRRFLRRCAQMIRSCSEELSVAADTAASVQQDPWCDYWEDTAWVHADENSIVRQQALRCIDGVAQPAAGNFVEPSIGFEDPSQVRACRSVGPARHQLRTESASTVTTQLLRRQQSLQSARNSILAGGLQIIMSSEQALLEYRTRLVHSRGWAAVSSEFPPEPGFMPLQLSGLKEAGGYSRSGVDSPRSLPHGVVLANAQPRTGSSRLQRAVQNTCEWNDLSGAFGLKQQKTDQLLCLRNEMMRWPGFFLRMPPLDNDMECPLVPMLPDGTPISVLAWSSGWHVDSSSNSGSSIAALQTASSDFVVASDWQANTASVGVQSAWKPHVTHGDAQHPAEEVPILAADAVHSGRWQAFGGTPGLFEVVSQPTYAMRIGWHSRSSAAVVPAQAPREAPFCRHAQDRTNDHEAISSTKCEPAWSYAEQLVFFERFLHYPKDFQRIASFLRQKSVKDCVAFYYLVKHRACLKQALRAYSIAQRKRAVRLSAQIAMACAFRLGCTGQSGRFTHSIAVQDTQADGMDDVGVPLGVELTSSAYPAQRLVSHGPGTPEWWCRMFGFPASLGKPSSRWVG